MPMSAAAQAYRAILRSAKVTFKGDDRLLRNSARYTRSKFMENKDITDEKKLKRLLTAANATAELLRRNVVQGVKMGDAYHLNIDQNKEINDNTKPTTKDKASSNKQPLGSTCT